jgi:multiple sugar transport system substrate-binding protein
MNNKIVLFFLVLALVICGSLFASGGGQQPAAGGPITLKWAMWDYDISVYYKPLVAAYEAKNPNIKIECVDLGSADYNTVLLTQLLGNADFDVVTIKEIPSYANLVRQNRLEPLNAFIKSSNIDTNLYGGIVEQLTINGEVYTLPFRRDTYLVYYNKDIFDKAGVPYPTNDMTFEQYEQLARRLTSGSGANKIYGGHYHTWASQVQNFGLLQGKNTLVGGSYEFLIPYYETALRQQDEGTIQAYTTLKTSGTHYSGVFFNSQIGMMHQGTWFISTQIAQVAKGEATSKNWGLVKLPHPVGVAAGTSPASLTGVSVNRNAKNKQAALEFAKFLSSAEAAAILARGGTIPAMSTPEVLNIISSIPGFPTDANSKDALNVAQAYLEFPMNEKLADIQIVLNETHDAIMSKSISLNNGIQQMNQRIGQILGR